MDGFENKNPYAILGLEQGHQATADDIRKAYKKMAILKHPDKNRNNPNAAAEFDELKKAYELLTDDQAKGAYDDLIRAREAREARRSQHTEKRRKMMDELDRKERQAASEKSEEEQARARLKVELERLRQKAAEEHHRQAEAAAAVRRASAAASAAGAASTSAAAGAAAGAGAGPASAPGAASSSTQDQLSRSIKATWDSSVTDYSSERLRELFSRIGPVEDVVLRDRRKKSSKMSALVVFASRDDAVKALNTVTGDAKNPLLVVPVLKEVPEQAGAAAGTSQQQQEQQEQQQQQQPRTQQQGSTLFPGTAPAFTPAAPAFPVSKPAAGLFPVAGASNGISAAAAGGSTATAAGGSSFPGGSSFSSFPGASFSSFPGVPGQGVGAAAGASSLESSILDKMRKAAERDRLIAEMKEKEVE